MAEPTASDHSACIADKALGDRVRGYIDAEIGEDYAFAWGLADLDESDLFHLRNAVQRYFRHIATESVGDANDIRYRVMTVQRVGELVAAIETVEKARGEAATKQSKWRDAKRSAEYRAEQAEMRRKAAGGIKRPLTGGSGVTDV